MFCEQSQAQDERSPHNVSPADANLTMSEPNKLLHATALRNAAREQWRWASNGEKNRVWAGLQRTLPS